MCWFSYQLFSELNVLNKKFKSSELEDKLSQKHFKKKYFSYLMLSTLAVSTHADAVAIN